MKRYGKNTYICFRVIRLSHFPTKLYFWIHLFFKTLRSQQKTSNMKRSFIIILSALLIAVLSVSDNAFSQSVFTPGDLLTLERSRIYQ